MTVYTLKGVGIGLPDWLVGTAIEDKIRAGDYESKESDAALKRLRKGWTVLELGAGLGFVSSVCASVVGAENVISVEANPRMLDPVRANLERNGFGDVTLLHGAVVGDDHTGETVTFRAGKLFWGGSIVAEGKHHDDMVEVPALPMSHLLAIYEPKFVMMDIEGAEAQLFERPWPRCVKHVVMEIHPSRYEDKLVIKRMVDCMSKSGLTYDPVMSNGRTLGFMRVAKGRG